MDKSYLLRVLTAISDISYLLKVLVHLLYLYSRAKLVIDIVTLAYFHSCKNKEQVHLCQFCNHSLSNILWRIDSIFHNWLNNDRSDELLAQSNWLLCLQYFLLSCCDVCHSLIREYKSVWHIHIAKKSKYRYICILQDKLCQIRICVIIFKKGTNMGKVNGMNYYSLFIYAQMIP